MPRIGDWIKTFSGVQFFPFDPRVEDFRIEDIAHSLAMQCRFTGHCSRFYSVAEHSWRVSHMVPAEDGLWGLLHDASEAYLCDLARPVKRSISQYRIYEARLQNHIAAKWLGSLVCPESVKRADNLLLAIEGRDLMNGTEGWSEMPERAVFGAAQ